MVFFLWQKGSGVLANSSFNNTEVSLSFLTGRISSSVSAEACATLKLSAGLTSTKNSFNSLPFLKLLLCFFHFFHFFYRTLRFNRQKLSTFSSFTNVRLHWVLGLSFPQDNVIADELAKRGVLLYSPEIFLLLPVAFTHLFSLTEGLLPPQKFLTKKFFLSPPKNLCFLITLAVLPLLLCNKHSFV